VEGEKYCLKWNDFTSNLSSAFNELRDDEDFFDVTLLTEESEIRCHKLILGACSPHFRHIIKRLSTVQNPAIYLRGVRHEDIKNILEFMYLGEVSVAQEDLDSFLSVAQDLCIKGLTQGDNNQSQPNPGPSQSSRSSSSSVQGPPPKRLKMTKNNGETAKNIPKQEPKMEYKPEPEVIPEVIDDPDDPQVLEEYDDYYEDDSTPGPSDPGGDKDLEEDQGAGLAQLPDGRVTCLICGKTLSNVANGKRHYSTSHQPNQPARCKICKKLCKNKQSRDAHLRQSHGLTPKLMRNIIQPPKPPQNLNEEQEYQM